MRGVARAVVVAVLAFVGAVSMCPSVIRTTAVQLQATYALKGAQFWPFHVTSDAAIEELAVVRRCCRTDAAYYLIPTYPVPLLMPVQRIPVVGPLVADILDPVVRLMVEAGYDRTVSPGVGAHVEQRAVFPGPGGAGRQSFGGGSGVAGSIGGSGGSGGTAGSGGSSSGEGT